MIFDNSSDLYLLNNSSDGNQSPYNYIADKEVNAKISILEDEYKVPFEMHFEGYKYKEIAEKLDIPLGTVKSRIFIARKKLMESLPEFQFDDK